MFAELMAVINAFMSVAKITLSEKDKKALQKKVREASQIIEKATPEEIFAYDHHMRDLLDAVRKYAPSRAYITGRKGHGKSGWFQLGGSKKRTRKQATSRRPRT